LLNTLLKKVSCKQKLNNNNNNNNNNKEPHFVKDSQVESKDGLGKPGHLSENLLISKATV